MLTLFDVLCAEEFDGDFGCFLYVGRMWWWHVMSKSDSAWCELGEDLFPDFQMVLNAMNECCKLFSAPTHDMELMLGETVKSVKDSQLFTFEFFSSSSSVLYFMCVEFLFFFYHLILFLVVTYFWFDLLHVAITFFLMDLLDFKLENEKICRCFFLLSVFFFRFFTTLIYAISLMISFAVWCSKRLLIVFTLNLAKHTFFFILHYYFLQLLDLFHFVFSNLKHVKWQILFSVFYSRVACSCSWLSGTMHLRKFY